MKSLLNWFKNFRTKRQEHWRLPEDLRLENPMIVTSAPLTLVPPVRHREHPNYRSAV